MRLRQQELREEKEALRAAGRRAAAAAAPPAARPAAAVPAPALLGPSVGSPLWAGRGHSPNETEAFERRCPGEFLGNPRPGILNDGSLARTIPNVEV